MWPWPRTDRAAGAAAASAPAWRSLPPIQRSLAPLAPVAPRDEFAESLQSWRNPSFLAPLGHLVNPDAPSGVIEGLLSPASSPLAHSDGPLLAFAQRPARRRGVVQRMLAAFAGPPELALPVQAPTVDQPPPPSRAVPVQPAAANAGPFTPAVPGQPAAANAGPLTRVVPVQRASADAATPLTQAPPLDPPARELSVLPVLPSADVVAETPTLGTGGGSGSGHEIRSGAGHVPPGTPSPPEPAGRPIPISAPHEHPAPVQRSVQSLMPDRKQRPAQRDDLEPAQPFPAATDDRAPVRNLPPAEGPTVAPLLGQLDIVDAAQDIDPSHEPPGAPPPISSPAPDRPNPPRRLGLGAPLTPDDTRGSWPRVQRSPSLPNSTTPEPQALTLQRVPTRSAASPPEPEPERAPPAQAVPRSETVPRSEVTIAPLLGQDGVVDDRGDDDRGDAALVDEPPPSPPAHSEGSVALPSVQLELAAPSPPVVPPAAPSLSAPRVGPPEMVRRTPAAAAPQVAPLVGLGGTVQRSATQPDEMSGGLTVAAPAPAGSTPGGDPTATPPPANADGPPTGAPLPLLRVEPSAASSAGSTPGGDVTVAPLVGLGGTVQRSATQPDEVSGGSSVAGVASSTGSTSLTGSTGLTGPIGSTPGGDLRVIPRPADADGPATGAMLPVLRVVAPNAAEPGSALPGDTSVAAFDLTPAVVVARLVGDRTPPLLTVPPSANPAADRAERPPTNGPATNGPATTATVQRASGPPGARLAVPGAQPYTESTPPPVVQATPLVQAGPLVHARPVVQAPPVVPVEPVTPVVQTVAVPEPLPEAPAESVPVQPSAAGEPAAPPAPAGGGTPDELVTRLFDPLLRRLKAELRLERERRGVLTDLRH